jgi:flagellum-specific ATP synthase
MHELIRLGAYRRGSDPELDRAIAVRPALEALLQQEIGERPSSREAFAALRDALTAAPA